MRAATETEPALSQTRASHSGRGRRRHDPELIEFASSFYALQPGDVILTSTPEGVSAIKRGDVLLAGIEKLGAMNVVVAART